MNVPFLDLKAGMDGIRAEVEAGFGAVLDRCDFVLGEAVGKLEREVAECVGVPHAVGVASGTDALKVALRALGVGPGDEVVTSPVTFIATAEAVYSLGARPVFVDICPASYNLHPGLVERFLDEECEAGPDGKVVRKSTGGRVAGLLPVHLFGQCANMERLLGLARGRGLFVLEDACQAFGGTARVGGAVRKAGSMGDAAAFSFYPSKNVGGAGDGGMIVTADAGLASKCRVLRVHGAARQYEHDEQGFNSRLDTLQAVFVSAKLSRLDSYIEARRERAAGYARLFETAAAEWGFDVVFSSDVKGADAPPEKTLVLPSEMDGRVHSYNVYSVRVADRDGLVEFLRSRGVGTNTYYPIPLHLQKVYEPLGYAAGDFPAAESVCSTVTALPMYPELTDEQQRYVVDCVSDFLCGR